MTQSTPRTHLAFQHDGKRLQLKTTVVEVLALADLSEVNRRVFRQAPRGEGHVVVTQETIFHPQGGGQPTDEGFMAVDGAAGTFSVTSVRMNGDAGSEGQVLHLGQFVDGAQAPFQPGAVVEQTVDAEKRRLYSRLHTAGHVLGAAVRHLLAHEIDGFDELKASHFPGSAACEFQGAIEGRWKGAIQERVTDYIQRSVPVEIAFWTEHDFRREGLQRLIPHRTLLPPGEHKFRVVKLAGLETYPCGGTHVDTTDLCGETTVTKISRSKGTSRVSYSVK